MTKPEVIKLLAMIAAAYPNMKEVDKATVELWHEYLKDLPLKEGLENVKKHIMTSQFPPTIADILGTKALKGNRFHNFKQYSNRFTEEEIENICRKKRENHMLQIESIKSIEGEG